MSMLLTPREIFVTRRESCERIPNLNRGHGHRKMLTASCHLHAGISTRMRNYIGEKDRRKVKFSVCVHLGTYEGGTDKKQLSSGH